MNTRISQRGVILPVIPEGPSTVGVYRLWSAVKPGSYVGSTNFLQKRANDHWRAIQLGLHATPALQKFADYVFLENLEFEVLEYFPAGTQKFARDLLDAEERWALEYHARGEGIGELCGYRWSDTRRGADVLEPCELTKRWQEAVREARYYRTLLMSYTPPSATPEVTGSL